MSTNRPTIKTFGCRLNIWESEVMRKQAEAAGLNDVVIINTCAVTSEAEKQARQAIRKLRRERPDTQIVVTGCAAQIDPDSWADMAETDYVVGNADKLTAAPWQQLAEKSLPPMQLSDIMDRRDIPHHMFDSFDDHTRAFLQIQQGCDHRCTFCIIPFGRGPSRSVPVQTVIKSARALIAAGSVEIVLTGVDITSWGDDLPGRPKLGTLVRQLLDGVPELARLRLSSIDPAELDAPLMECLEKEARLMPHLHLSIQHGDDIILKRMKRRHLRRDILRFVAEARRRRPDVVFGADFIAGFPTESDAAHQASLSLIREAGLTHLHVFGYSAREGTPAAQMPQLEKAVIKARVAEVRALGDQQRDAHLKIRSGGVDMMLVERGKTGYLSGFEKAALPPELAVEAGTLLPVELQGADQGVMQVVPLISDPENWSLS
ncbi:MAG: tRNA (N(6)-L-threonylcarbamoyladenosine(37)-C(2))-methylthiotransferase MtaB [Alphaproteobacteria bacterium]|nr:tRNA (N(6)-L-threonylcarbamoyladenosine(37)-C(2))-methylthiotransferase MtaB [Alphaproteobacteria bacterium]